MDVRNALALVGLAGLVAIPVAAAAQSGTAIVASANGGVHWIIPLPNPFGVEVVNQPLAFNARKYADGSVSGRFEYHQLVEGETFMFNVDVTCMNVYNENRAKIGGVVTQSSDPTEPPGVFAWFQVFDNGEGANAPPDRSSLAGSVTRLPTRPSATVPTCLALDLGTYRETSRSASESRSLLAGGVVTVGDGW